MPLSPLWVSFCLAIAQPLAFAFLYYSLREIDPHFAGAEHGRLWVDVRSMLINALMLSFLPAGLVWLERAVRRATAEMVALHPVLDVRVPAEPFLTRAGRIAGLVGMTVLFVAVYAPGGDLWLFGRTDYWILPHYWNLLFALVLGWLIGRFTLAMVSRARDISRLAARVARIDLLDRAGMAPLVRFGLNSALLWVALLTLILLHLANPDARLSILALLPWLLAVPAAALLLPVRGARERIRSAKRERLVALRGEIRAGEDALERGGSDADRAALRLPALLALEARIDAVREWPFDASSWARFGLYVSLGLGSWLGAAAVERALDWLWS
jgi:hypothetical protein